MCADNAVRVTGLEPGQRLRAVNEGRCIIGHSQHEGFNGRFAHFHEQLVNRDLPFQFTVRPQTHSKNDMRIFRTAAPRTRGLAGSYCGAS